MKSALYWKGAIGRAHSSLTKSALQQVGKAQTEANQGLVHQGRERQAKGKKQHQEGQIMSSYHGRLNMLRAFIQRTDLQHRFSSETSICSAATYAFSFVMYFAQYQVLAVAC